MASKKTSTLREWREKHFAQMDENIRVWQEIRDNVECAAKDRSEAAKNIARALGGLAPERVQKPGQTHTKDMDALTPEEETMIASILDGIKN